VIGEPPRTAARERASEHFFERDLTRYS